MQKANKQGGNSNGKPRVKIGILNVLLILAGADLILLLSPEVGFLNGLFYIPGIYTWPALLLGVALLLFGFRHLYRPR
ncbi:hypothetical protein [Pelodictyon luteolum]|uniref:Uncharacterized protein n=1 Tax=Chlorobium luteolum (strain DSM 273 / BCRC 81028 / 2530) TaxID=319225 RepID=Q3B6I2_CHLL3|nr:hypothetical protein [Pelodictyon luteolum]ABB23049.1 hypothetical protein Plut_0159 [Pelodictyon luteolum DSM 273]